MANKLAEPDYEFWCRVDEWSFKEAALLLKGLDPLNFRKLRFNVSGEPPEKKELKEAYKVFLILKSFQWEDRYSRNAAHPFAIFKIAAERDLDIPPKLAESIQLRYQREQERRKIPPDKIFSPKGTEEDSSEELSVRERHSLLKAIGIFTFLLAGERKYAERFVINKRINAYQVTKILIEKATDMNINTQGIKSLNRKIKEAIELLEEESL